MSPGPAYAVVTGASRGIGLATALSLAQRGVALVLLGRASSELDGAALRCEREGGPSVRLLHVDLAQPLATQSAARALLDVAGPPSVLIHNAGVAHRAAIEGLSLEAWEEQLRVNLSAPFVLTQALLPAMRHARKGRILFVGSISSTLGSARLSGYCASKWGIVGFMKSLAEELSDSGLMAAAVLPGSVATRMLEGSGFEARLSAEDVAKTLTFLALDAPLSHNGAVIEMFGV